MRCKKHLSDFSSAVGVCATCLRERLFAVVKAQSQNQWVKDGETCLKSDPGIHLTTPSRLQFPCSVSPYISRRKSDVHGLDRRFYSTPLVGVREVKKSSGGRFLSFFSHIFRSKSEKCADSGLIFDPGVKFRLPEDDSPRRRRNQAHKFAVDVTATGDGHRSLRDRGRGMSPSRISDEEPVENCGGYVSESSQGWRQTPRRTPARAGHGKNPPSLTFCLSPLVRASPNRQRNPRNTQLQTESSGGEAAKSQLSVAPSFGKNRSRKLADFGKYNNPNI